MNHALTPLFLSTLAALIWVAPIGTQIEANADTGTIPADANGLVQVPSNFSVDETVNRLTNKLQENSRMTIFAQISHSDNAAAGGSTLRPTELILFGNATQGTSLLACNQTVGIDLPMKVLIWEDADGQVWFTYNDPAYLFSRHHLEDCGANSEAAMRRLSTALSNLAQSVTQGE